VDFRLAPAIGLSFNGDANTRLWQNLPNQIDGQFNSNSTLVFEETRWSLLDADAVLAFGAARDAVLGRKAANAWRVGQNAAAAAGQTIAAADSTGAGNAGADLTLTVGTGGAGGAQGSVVIDSGSPFETQNRIELEGLPAYSGCTSKTLTDAAAAVSFVRVAVATNGYMAGELEWIAKSSDGADQIVTFGKQPIVGVDKAGTVSCATSAQYATTTKATNANTLVCTVTVATSTTNCDAQVTCTNNTAGDQNMDFCWRFEQPIASTAVVP
jgi:hypothetical protein